MEKNDILKFIENVIDKKFEVKNKGYDPNSVDQTLDEIFANFSKYITKHNKLVNDYEQLSNNYKDLEKKLNESKKEAALLSSQLDQLKSGGYSMDQINKRLLQVEKNIESSGHTNPKTQAASQTKKTSATKVLK